jgi:lipopolysaccharide export system protein LptA
MAKKRVRTIIFSGVLAALSIVLGPAGFTASDAATVTADSMRYDPNTGNVVATGNVHLTDSDGEVFGDRGLGSISGDNFEVHGNVRGSFNTKDGKTVSIVCESAVLSGTDSSGRVITASGGVKINRGRESLTADKVTWGVGAEKYSASGNVLGEFEAYSIDADAVSRDRHAFEARTIRKFTEHARKMEMSAERAEGMLNENNEVTELTAEGGVEVTAPDKRGVVTRATGGKGIYSLARGTLVLSGRAMLSQAGRVLNSENIVYFIDSGRIDALGKPSITFETDRKK